MKTIDTKTRFCRKDHFRAAHRPARRLSKLLRAASVALVLFAAWALPGPAVSAGDPVAGRASYVRDCIGCHGPLPSAIVLSAANAPDVIADHVRQFFIDLQETRPQLHLTLGNFADIAAYLATLLNYEGLWWNSPGGSESGWGINLAHQGDIVFASWFTYDLAGRGLWIVMTAPKSAPGTYSGTLFTTTGPAFDAVPFDPTQVVHTAVGTGTLTFTDADNGSFAYMVHGISQTKAITRQEFGRLPNCATATGRLAAATNYQDLWWASPAGSESGWGINFTHQDDTIFATWFTYDVDQAPMWLVVTALKTSPATYSGTLYRTTGPAFNAMPFDPADVVATAVGSATFIFVDGNQAKFAYTVNGLSQTKAIIRQVFSSPGTVCH